MHSWKITSCIYVNKAMHCGIPSKRTIRFYCEGNIRANIPIYIANIRVACSVNTPLRWPSCKSAITSQFSVCWISVLGLIYDLHFFCLVSCVKSQFTHPYILTIVTKKMELVRESYLHFRMPYPVSFTL